MIKDIVCYQKTILSEKVKEYFQKYRLFQIKKKLMQKINKMFK